MSEDEDDEGKVSLWARASCRLTHSLLCYLLIFRSISSMTHSSASRPSVNKMDEAVESVVERLRLRLADHTFEDLFNRDAQKKALGVFLPEAKKDCHVPVYMGMLSCLCCGNPSDCLVQSMGNLRLTCDSRLCR